MPSKSAPLTLHSTAHHVLRKALVREEGIDSHDAGALAAMLLRTWKRYPDDIRPALRALVERAIFTVSF